MKYGLNEKIILKIQDVFSRYPEIEKAILYGSRAKGNYKQGSDIDLTLVASNLDHRKFYDLKNTLDDLNLPYIIDLSLREEIDNQDLLSHIDRVGIIFYKKDF